MSGAGPGLVDAVGAGIAVLVVLYLAVIVGSLVMLIVAPVAIVRRPAWQWKLADQEKVLWLLLVILVNLFAVPSLISWFRIRPKLIAVERAAADGAHLGARTPLNSAVTGPRRPGTLRRPAPGSGGRGRWR